MRFSFLFPTASFRPKKEQKRGDRMTAMATELSSFSSFGVAFFVLALLPLHSAFQLLPRTGRSPNNSKSLGAATSFLPAFESRSTILSSTTQRARTNVEFGTYQHDGWTLKYKFKPASPGYENASPLLLIHPVGIGMSSWYWDEFLEHYVGGPVYAPDLIGCGIDNGSDAWVPEERGLFFPLSWVEGCETLMQQIMVSSSAKFSSPFGNNKKVTVVTQGGLAPVGVLLAYRNPDIVSKLVMSSPPTWEDMTTAVDQKELESNYNFLKSTQGGWAFSALESEWAVRFFSNLFLFEGECDDKWLNQCLRECKYKSARPPIQAFNAGLMQHRSYIEELTKLPQETTVVQGKDDASRIPLRKEYERKMKNCKLVTLSYGKNVLPWECAETFAEILQQKRK